MPVIGTKDKLVRFSYANVWEPRSVKPGVDKPAYSVCVLIDKKHKDIIKQVELLTEDAIKRGITKGTINKAMVESPTFKKPLHDGDLEAAMVTDGSKDYLKGHMFFNARSPEKQQPAIVDKFAQPIMNRDDFYSGCYGVIDVGPFAYNNQGRGVSFGLNSIMKREDGERLDGRVSAEKAFADYIDEQSEDDLK